MKYLRHSCERNTRLSSLKSRRLTRLTCGERYENLRILNTRGRARALEVFTRAKLWPPYLALWSSAVRESGLTRVS